MTTVSTYPPRAEGASSWRLPLFLGSHARARGRSQQLFPIPKVKEPFPLLSQTPNCVTPTQIKEQGKYFEPTNMGRDLLFFSKERKISHQVVFPALKAVPLSYSP